MFGAVVPAHAAAGFALFGSGESVSRNLAPFPKWGQMLKRDERQRTQRKEHCANATTKCLPARWVSVIARAEGKPPLEMLTIVNQGFNASKYTLDRLNWGVEDYWQTPIEFLTRTGDCEDYAIIKYMTLKLLGVDPSTMRIVVLEDRNLRLLHSVLVVRVGGVNYILDNQVAQVIADTQIHHYVPIYSINEQNWWRHIPR